MKHLSLLFSLLLALQGASAQNVLLVEHFNYPAGTTLQSNGWNAHSAGATNPIMVSNAGLSWSATPYLGSGIGNAAMVSNTGSDENRPFASYPDSGDVYVSFLMSVNTVATSTNSGYFLHIGEYANPAAPVFTAISTAFRARTYVAPGSTPAQFRLGLTFNSSTVPSTPGVDLSNDLNTGATYLVVVKYSFIPGGASNDSVSLYVFADGDNISTEPASPAIGPVAGTAADMTVAQYVALRQFNAAQNITVDGLIVQDNWNLLPTPPPLIGPSLLSPPDMTALTVTGPAATPVNISWTSAQNASAPVAYTWQLAARASGNFNAPLLSIPSNNSGSDTVLTLSFAQIDAALASLGVAVGNTVQAIWRVRAIAGSDTVYSLDTFNIDITRGLILSPLAAFDLLSPPDMTSIVVSASSMQTANITWSATTAGTFPVTYQWLAVAPGGNFASPLLSLPANNSGSDNALTLPYSVIDATLAGLGIMPGASAVLDWTVRASASTTSRLANQVWRITLTRQGPPTTLSPFDLLTPPDMTSIVVSATSMQTANITWSATTAGTFPVTYQWLAVAPGGNFATPLLALPANNGGSDNALTLPYAAIDATLAGLGIMPGASAVLDWTVRASADTASRLANQVWRITLTREDPSSSLDDQNFGKSLSLYPNPANSVVYLKSSAQTQADARISLLNATGQQLQQIESRLGGVQAVELNLQGLSNGLYLLKVESAQSHAVLPLLIQR